MKPTVEQIQRMVPAAGMLRNHDASPENPSPVLDAAEVREVLMDEVERLRREVECWKVLASTEDGFWPLGAREAVRSLDLEACKTEAARGHEFVRSLQAASTPAHDIMRIGPEQAAALQRGADVVFVRAATAKSAYGADIASVLEELLQTELVTANLSGLKSIVEEATRG